jgi:hypothetical protein
MDAANTTSQAEQIKTDTHQTACVKNESAPPYEVQVRSEEENIIAQELDILSRRMRKAEAFFSSPSAVRDFLRLKMAELEFEVSCAAPRPDWLGGYQACAFCTLLIAKIGSREASQYQP